MDLSNIKKIFISGIGGIGVSALARFFVAKGIEVVGSDLVLSEITEGLEKIGVKVFSEQKADNVTSDFNLFIYSAAVPATNPERLKAKELGLTQRSYFEILGEISRDFRTVAVSGTHGKSTTTAMIGVTLIKAGKDPTVIVGSCYEKFDNNFHYGQSDLFVVESCEYRAHLLLLKPWTIVLNNIEEDHLDFYKDINHIIQTFQQFVNGLRSENDLLVINNDDLNIRKLILPKCKIVRYGLASGADVCADNIRKLPGKQFFDVIYYGHNIGEFELNIPGDFNIYNALATISFCLTLDVPIGIIKDFLKEFRGIWRRFEVIRNDEITVISDYAHHPTAVKNTIKAAREFFPGRRIVAVFQPHQHDRTKKLFNELVKSFDLADVIILSEIYDVAGREEGIEISSADLVEKIKKITPKKQIVYAKDLASTIARVNELKKNEDVILIMGAGDVYTVVKNIS